MKALEDLTAALTALVDRDLLYFDAFVVGGQISTDDITLGRAALARWRTTSATAANIPVRQPAAPQADAQDGMDWWNAPSANERRQKLSYVESLEWEPSPANAWVIEKRDRARSGNTA